MARTSLRSPRLSKIVTISSRNLRFCAFTGGRSILTVATKSATATLKHSYRSVIWTSLITISRRPRCRSEAVKLGRVLHQDAVAGAFVGNPSVEDIQEMADIGRLV